MRDLRPVLYICIIIIRYQAPLSDCPRQTLPISYLLRLLELVERPPGRLDLGAEVEAVEALGLLLLAALPERERGNEGSILSVLSLSKY